MNFEEVYEEYLKYAKNQHKKQGFVTLQSNFNSRILPYFKDYNIEDIKPRDIIEWQNKIYDLNFKYGYTSKLYINFSSFMQFCCDYYELDINPVKQVKNFKNDYEKKKIDFYNYKEFKTFIKNVDNLIYKRFFETMFFTGTRPGEAMALKFSDIQGKYLSITKNLTTKGGRTLDTPKNRSSVRKVKIDNKLRKDLLKLERYYQNKYNSFDSDYFIFGGIKPISPSTTNRIKKKACERANLRPITLHQFRHSHATLLANENIPFTEIKKRLGHSRLSTTTDIYIHEDLTQEKRVINTLNSVRNNHFITLQSNFKIFISILKH